LHTQEKFFFYIKYKNLLQQKILCVVANKIKIKIKESASIFRLVRWNIIVRSNKNLGCVGVEKANHLEQCKV
jgi:hypothetical protein